MLYRRRWNDFSHTHAHTIHDSNSWRDPNSKPNANWLEVLRGQHIAASPSDNQLRDVWRGCAEFTNKSANIESVKCRLPYLQNAKQSLYGMLVLDVRPN